MILSRSYTTKIKVFTVKKTKKCFKFFFNHLHIRIGSNNPYWPKAIRIWRWSEKNLRHFLVFLTAPIFVNKAYFFLFPISSTQQLPHFCFKPISVIHIWKSFNVYFLNYFVGTALFFPKNVSLLGGWTKTKYFWQFSAVSALFHGNPYFFIGLQEAYLHAMTVGTSNKCAVHMKIMTRTN